jgi:imidazolonepropionase-like amidohydrolase
MDTLRLALVGALASTAALFSSAHAQDLTHKAPPQSRRIILHDAVIHPVSGPVMDRGFIVFDQGVITQVGQGELPVGLPTPGDDSIDLDGKHVYPGLFAPWTQLGLTEIQAVRQTADLGEGADVSPEVCPALSVNPDSTLIPVTRSNGVLLAAVRPEGGRLPGQVSVIRLEGWTAPEMQVRADAGQVCRWPTMRTIDAWWMDRSEEDQRKDITNSIERIHDAFDAAQAYIDQRAAAPESLIDLRWEAMRSVLPVKEGESRTPPQASVFFTANDYDQINAAVSFAVERGLKAVIVGGRDAPLCADLLKSNDIPVIVNGTHAMPARDDAPYDDAFTLPARLAAAGIRFTICNADDAAHERNTPYSVATAVKHGLEPEIGLRCITLDAAKIFGVADRYGSLETGKSATLIVTTGDPLEVMTDITAAYVDGRRIDLSNKQTELAEKYRERYRQIGELKEPRKP